MNKFIILTTILLALRVASARVVEEVSTRIASGELRTLFQSKGDTVSIGDIVVRKTGDVLFTTLRPAPQLYILKDPTGDTPVASLIYEFPGMTGVMSITESSPDIFAVVGGKYYDVAVPAHGSFSIWAIDFNQAGQPKITKVTDLPSNLSPARLASVPGQNGIVMLAHSLGSLYRVDLHKRTIALTAQLPEMRPTMDASPALGINGIVIRNGYIYWTNSFASTVFRLPISPQGIIVGPPKAEIVATIPDTILNDIAIDGDGTLWVTSNCNNTVIAINSEARNLKIAAVPQNSVFAAGVVSATFGQQADDQQMLYATTSGGLVSRMEGTFSEPAKIIAIDTKNISF